MNLPTKTRSLVPSAADNLENILVNTQKISINNGLIVKRLENNETKGEIAHYEQFLLLSHCFQKLSALEESVRKLLHEGKC